MFETLGNLWKAALDEAKVVEGVVVDGVHVVEAKVAPYIPGSVVSTLDQARTKIVNVGSRAVDYVAGNPPGSLQKGIQPWVSPGAAIVMSPSNLQNEIGQYTANIKKLDSWKLTLGSLQGMASKAKAQNLVTAVDVWISGQSAGGYLQGYNANADALDAAKDLLSDVQSGTAVDPTDAKEYNALKPGAVGGFDNSNSYAKRIYDAIVAASQKAASADIPTTVDYAAAVGSTLVTPVVAPVTGAYNLTVAAAKGAKKAASGAIDYAEKAGANILSVAEGVGSGYANVLKAAPYVLGAVALGYVLLSLPKPAALRNPKRRRARR